MFRWGEVERIMARRPRPPRTGRVHKVVGLVVEARVPGVKVGDLVELAADSGPVRAQVVGFRRDTALLMPLGELSGVGMGTKVVQRGEGHGTVRVGEGLLGRVVDGLGRPLDGRGELGASLPRPLDARPINPLERRPVERRLAVGVRVVDGFLTAGRGQRVAILAGAGVGKSVLLGSMARHTEADVTVLALIGERGREVREFLEKVLGEQERARCVVVVATSDQPPTVRVRAASYAMTVAEFFRDQGREVLFLMDSLTRLAMAAREIGLSAGEPPATKGYPPSVFAMLPRFLERAGAVEGKGSITGFYTVLVEGDDTSQDPLSDAIRAIVDGHVVLSRGLANKGHFPAVDVLQSTSRVFGSVASPEHRQAAAAVRAMLATYREAEDLINLGAYTRGSNPNIDLALERKPQIDRFLVQPPDESTGFDETVAWLESLATKEGGHVH